MAKWCFLGCPELNLVLSDNPVALGAVLCEWSEKYGPSWSLNSPTTVSLLNDYERSSNIRNKTFCPSIFRPSCSDFQSFRHLKKKLNLSDFFFLFFSDFLVYMLFGCSLTKKTLHSHWTDSLVGLFNDYEGQYCSWTTLMYIVVELAEGGSVFVAVAVVVHVPVVVGLLFLVLLLGYIKGSSGHPYA